MASNTNSPLKSDSPPACGLRPGLKWMLATASLFCLAGVLWYFRGHAPAATGQAEPAGPGAAAEAAGEKTGQAPEGATPVNTPPGSKSGVSVLAAAPQAPAPVPQQVAVDPATGALVAGLRQLTGTNAVLTAEGVAAWRTNFMNLVQSGSAAVPALRAFLDQKVDYAFSQEAAQALGYSSARLAAIDALRQIGGPDAVQAMQGLLGTTQTPKEVALLAADLEQASPGPYRQQALDAARAGLAAAAASKDPQLDVAPLFEVFQHYGDASAIPDLEKAAGQWNYYATIALANLPDNAGVPSLLHLADPASGSSSAIALEMVAQLAATNPDARQFLTTLVANETIPPNLWPYLTGPLSGDQFYPVDSAITQYPQLQSLNDLKTTHLAVGNQNFYTLPGNQNLTADGIQQQLALVGDLLKATSDPAAVQALQQAQATLTQRSTRVSAQAAPGTRP